MNWTSEHSLFVEDEVSLGPLEANDSKIFGHSGLTDILSPNCTSCVNELCIAEADYEVYRFDQLFYFHCLYIMLTKSKKWSQSFPKVAQNVTAVCT